MELTREHVLKMISKRVVEAILLSHHLSEYKEPHANYVYEKMSDWPSLDPKRSDIFNQVTIILRSAFGVEIHKSAYHFGLEDVE